VKKKWEIIKQGNHVKGVELLRAKGQIVSFRADGSLPLRSTNAVGIFGIEKASVL